MVNGVGISSEKNTNFFQLSWMLLYTCKAYPSLSIFPLCFSVLLPELFLSTCKTDTIFF